MFHGARIAVAPLDWGLGHSTRDIPVIEALLARDAHPVILADKGPLALLRDAFPQLPFAVLPGMEVRYGSGRSQAWAMARQFPAMLRSIRQERHLFHAVARDLHLDAVISDNRFGVRADHLPGVIMTHQVFPFTPLAQGALRRLNRHHLTRFHRCWVVDEPGAPGLAGELSHGPQLPANARYIGTISRMRPDNGHRGPHRIVAVISGPEPQRSLLEQQLLAKLQQVPGEHVLVQGQPQRSGEEQRGHVRIVPHLAGDALAALLAGAGLIVSRSGYTTLMDLAALGRSALLIPTPGQEEQEYLGALHQRTGRFLVQRQEAIDLQAALRWKQPQATATSSGAPLLAEALADLAALVQRRAATFVGR